MSITPEGRKRKGFLSSIPDPLRTFVIPGLIVPPAVFLGLFLTIGLLFLAEHLGRDLSFEQAFNGLLSLFLVLVFLPVCHAATHRWFWHIDKRTKAGDFQNGAKLPDMHTEPTEPAPPLRATGRQKLAYGLLYVAAVALLLFIYLPLGHHEALYHFIDRFSSGRASAGSFAGIIIIWLPLMAGMMGVFVFMERDMKKIRAHQVTGADKEAIELHLNWLGSFVTAVTMTGFMCYFLGNLILRYLA